MIESSSAGQKESMTCCVCGAPTDSFFHLKSAITLYSQRPDRLYACERHLRSVNELADRDAEWVAQHEAVVELVALHARTYLAGWETLNRRPELPEKK